MRSRKLATFLAGGLGNTTEQLLDYVMYCTRVQNTPPWNLFMTRGKLTRDA